MLNKIMSFDISNLLDFFSGRPYALLFLFVTISIIGYIRVNIYKNVKKIELKGGFR